VRDSDGSYQAFDVATYPPCCIWTFGLSINPAGTIAGYDNDGYNIYHGFVRNRQGVITILEAPDAGTGYNQGTLPLSINPAGATTGNYIDASSVSHGFLWTP
jgi:hypothetical protein